MSEMSATDSGINVTIETELGSEIGEDISSPSPHNGSEQCKDNMNTPIESNSMNQSVEPKDAIIEVNSNTNPLASVHEELSSSKTEEKVTKVLRFRLVMTILVIICLVVIIYQIPVILYLTDTPGQDSDSGGYDYENCSVSHKLSSSYTMILYVLY